MPNNILLYPFNAPVILTDDIFVAHKGITGSTSAADRQIAYFLAEEEVSDHIEALLSIATVTGTYQLNTTRPIVLDYAHVWSIKGVTIWSRNRNSSCTMSSVSSCAYLRDAQYGVVDVRLAGSCGCSNLGFDPYQIEISFESGIPSGTMYRPSYLRALTIQAQIHLNEMGLASINESVGDVGVQSFSNQEYSEKRVDLIRTRLGTSALSNYTMRVLSPLKRSRVGGL